MIETFWKAVLSLLGCVICTRFVSTGERPELHHVAPGSSIRSTFALAPICQPHHTGPRGFHSEPKGFILAYRPPFDSEVGILVWVIEDVARMLYMKCRFLGKENRG